MPVALSYPGVYIQEAASGVHTITGVATSIGAFFGQASMGPINTPVECFSYSDYQRVFGAPVPGTNLAQYVQEFFANGGSDCFVVRLVKKGTATYAQITLLDLNSQPVLILSAASQGTWGAGISINVDYNTPTPDSTFNLQVTYTSNGSVTQTESFSSLSMDSASPRYAPTFITQSSTLITAQAGSATASGITAGYSEARGLPTTAVGGWNAAIQAIWPAASDQGSFQISVDYGPWVTVNLSKAALASPANSASDTTTFNYIQTQINNALGATSGISVSITPPTTPFFDITSASTAKRSVQVAMAAPSVDLAQPLMLGVDQGGIEVARYADLRPVPNGIFLSGDTNGVIASTYDGLASVAANSLQQVSINGAAAVPLGLPATDFYEGAGGATDHDGIRQYLQTIATVINSNFPGFQATVAGYRLFVQNLNPSSTLSSDTLQFTTSGVAAVTTFTGEIKSNIPTYALSSASGGTYATLGPTPSDGTPPAGSDYAGLESDRSGFYALDNVDLFNIMVLSGDGIPDSDWPMVRAAAATYCQTRRAFLVLDAPVAWTKNFLPNVQSSDVSTFRAQIGNPDINCAVYYPRVQINDNGTLRYVGPSGMVAGMYAATDASRGVWKAPAGTNAALSGVQTLEVILSDKQNGVLNLQGVNCLRRMPAGFLIWGARTVAGFTNSGDTDWTYVPVRRMTLFLEESLYQGTQWVVFEPNDEPLWAQIRMNINAFMMGLFRQGAFQGTTPTQAFFVKCDSETTTQADIDNGIVNIVVGFAPLEPAEFVVITIQQMAGNLS